ncbi:hypothetical protein [Naasia sp. SYSU D00057]|uniref:hypothetical protein n=1 Tax=Naasia sp. SYSU D00057 TaxID=2817380 RepID=UPI001B30F023|nr:hypothetical protein [Naasia sp. SYSU D00057]
MVEEDQDRESRPPREGGMPRWLVALVVVLVIAAVTTIATWVVSFVLPLLT